MIAVRFPSLSPSQRARVAYLFADETFGSDPDAFVYETDDQGEIVSRKSIKMMPQKNRNYRIGDGSCSLHICVETCPSADEKRRADFVFDHLANLLSRQVHLETHACIHQV